MLEPEDIIAMAIGPSVPFDFEAVADRLDLEEGRGNTKEGDGCGSKSFDHDLFSGGLLRLLDWITRADSSEVVCAYKTLVSVRAMAVVWQVFPALVEGKSQATLAESLGVSRQFFSRQVIDFRRTFKLRGDPRRMRLRGGRTAQAFRPRQGGQS